MKYLIALLTIPLCVIVAYIVYPLVSIFYNIGSFAWHLSFKEMKPLFKTTFKKQWKEADVEWDCNVCIPLYKIENLYK